MYVGESFCLGENRHTHIYRYNQEDPTGPARDHKTTLKHMKDAVSSNSTVSVMHFSLL